MPTIMGGMGQLSALARFKLWLAAQLGPKYAPLIDIADRAVSAFGLAVAVKLVASGFDVSGIVSLSWWEALGNAGLLAGASVIKSAVMLRITGSPALLAPASRTLRARRDTGRRPEYHVPVRPLGQPSPRPKPQPTEKRKFMAKLAWNAAAVSKVAGDTGKSTRAVKYAYRILAEYQKRRGDIHKTKGATVRTLTYMALATGLVESNLKVYANSNNPDSLKQPHDAVGSDHGSVGIFQQQVGGARNSTANWGSTKGCMGVESSAMKFANAALRKINFAQTGNSNSDVGRACQRVQGSAFPDRYEQRVDEARALYNALIPYVEANVK